MRIQTLRKQGYGVKAIMAAYPQNYWKLSAVKKICVLIKQAQRLNARLAVVGRNPHDQTQTSSVDKLICSQESQSGQHLSTRETPFTRYNRLSAGLTTVRVERTDCSLNTVVKPGLTTGWRNSHCLFNRPEQPLFVQAVTTGLTTGLTTDCIV